MIRYDNIWNNFLTFENFYEAFLEARKNKRYRPNILVESRNIEDTLFAIMQQLSDNAWKPYGYYEFEARNEVKRRIIHAPTFKDRIVHHALYRQIAPLFEKKFIYDTYANRKDKGTHRAVKRTRHFLRAAKSNNRVYILQCDISKYYPSIDKEILLKELSRTIKDEKILNILSVLINDYKESGIPLGALTSQLFANIYLNPLDHYIKDVLRVKYYLRYMDDFIIIYNDKAYLWGTLNKIDNFLNKNLKLKLNPKAKIYSATQGIDFCGYRIWSEKILPRKRNIKAAKLRFKNLSKEIVYQDINIRTIQSKIASFTGYCKHCNSRRTYYSAIKNLEALGNIIAEVKTKSWMM